MTSFRGDRLRQFVIPVGTAWLLTEVAEAKGRQEGLSRLLPETLRELGASARIQSVESSNRIEGVVVDPRRLRPLVVEDDRPRNRSEEEIQGYRRALDLVHGPSRIQAVRPELLLRLHALTLAGSGDAGAWKAIDNEIVELAPGRPPRIRFRPVSAKGTPAAVDELCRSYRDAIAGDEVPSLLAAAALVLDFLCIHPFRDGNGRVSRLLTLFALDRLGFDVGRYVSLERLIEEARDEYYDALLRSSQGWHEAEHDLVPWLNHFLGILRRAYRELEARIAEPPARHGAKTAAIEAAVAGFGGEFTRKDLERACPGSGPDLVRKVLRELQSAGRVEPLGRGPGARWRRRW